MIYTELLQKAIHFSITVHEVNQKQKRKGKDIAYITHPLTVGLILARAGANEATVMAGILHDTIEDSVHEHKVTKEQLVELFGIDVADLVNAVTENDKHLSWESRKAEALSHIDTFGHDAILVKSADVISNMSEILDDHARDGEATWSRFHASKEKMLNHALKVMDALLAHWPESPLSPDLMRLRGRVQEIHA